MLPFDEFAADLLCGSLGPHAVPQRGWRSRFLLTPAFSMECCIDITCAPLERRLRLTFGFAQESQLWTYYNQLTERPITCSPLVGIRIIHAAQDIDLPPLKSLAPLTPTVLRGATEQKSVVCDGIGIIGWFQETDEIERLPSWNFFGSHGAPRDAAMLAIDLASRSFVDPVPQDYLTKLRKQCGMP